MGGMISDLYSCGFAALLSASWTSVSGETELPMRGWLVIDWLVVG